MCADSDLSSLSRTRGDPHLATCDRPFDAYPLYFHTLQEGKTKLHAKYNRVIRVLYYTISHPIVH